MKFFKVFIVVLIAVFAFSHVDAQNRGPRKVVVVKKRVVHHRYHKRVPPPPRRHHRY